MQAAYPERPCWYRHGQMSDSYDQYHLVGLQHLDSESLPFPPRE